MVCNILHHLKTLTHITLDLKMHKDRAYKAGDKDVNALWQFDTETFCSFEDNQSKNRDQCHLNEEDLESSLESSMHVAWVQLHFLH